MISQLKGKVSFTGDRYLVLSVGGVGYKVYATLDTIRAAGKSGNELILWTHLAVREDALDLYGFTEKGELEFFELLLSVSGIGPRSALAILNLAPVSSLRKAIASGDATYLTKVSGIGRKTAEKIVLELKDKLGSGIEAELPELKEEADAIEALHALGYTHGEAREALKRVSKDVAGTNARLKEALKLLGNGK